MSKPIPLQLGKYYHIYNRGNNREDLFIDERNYHYFMRLYAKYIQPIADTHAYCLLCNHFHFLVRIKTIEEQEEWQNKTLGVSKTPRVYKAYKPRSPSQQFGNLFNAYAKAINKTYNSTGSLFQHPFGRIEVTLDAYFVQLVRYIHCNPEFHGFEDDFRTWLYSSYQTILSTKPTFLKREEVLAWFGGAIKYEDLHCREGNEHQIVSLIRDDFN